MLHPFRAIRPTRDKAYLVATRSYISYNAAELEDKLENNPYTFLHVINPMALHDQPVDVRFDAVRNRYERFWEEGIFQKDEEPTFYIYEQQTQDRTYRGIIGLLEAESLHDGRTLPHEKTLENREQLFAHYLDKVGFQAEPVLVFGETSAQYKDVLTSLCSERAEYEFATTDRHVHRLWLMPQEHVSKVEAMFKSVPRSYIADGHHRLASSVRLAEEHKEYQAAQGVLCLFMDEEQVGIESFERWFKLVEQRFAVKDLESRFEVQEISGPHDDFGSCDFQMYFEGKWFGLSHKDHKLDNLLSTQILLDTVLKPLLGVIDERNDNRLTYVRQTHDDQSENMVKLGYDIGFRLPPIPVDLLKEVAEARGSMPPKSTYIEPKLRSGLLLHEFK